ncbi:hypothetical protein Dimus_038087 [Dionaea muscipula]
MPSSSINTHTDLTVVHTHHHRLTTTRHTHCLHRESPHLNCNHRQQHHHLHPSETTEPNNLGNHPHPTRNSNHSHKPSTQATTAKPTANIDSIIIFIAYRPPETTSPATILGKRNPKQRENKSIDTTAQIEPNSNKSTNQRQRIVDRAYPRSNRAPNCLDLAGNWSKLGSLLRRSRTSPTVTTHVHHHLTASSPPSPPCRRQLLVGVAPLSLSRSLRRVGFVEENGEGNRTEH